MKGHSDRQNYKSRVTETEKSKTPEEQQDVKSGASLTGSVPGMRESWKDRDMSDLRPKLRIFSFLWEIIKIF